MEAPERARSMAARAARPTSNPGGSPEATRRLVNKAFLEALAEDFRQGGAEAIAKVRKTQPAAYMKICALLVPREMKVEHSQRIKEMTDEQIERSIVVIEEILAAREAGAAAKVIEGVAEPAALPRGPNKVMDAADTAVGARERKSRKRKPRKRKVPSPTSVIS